MNNNKKVQGDKIAGITRRTRHSTRLVRDVTMVVNSSDAPGEYDWMINNKKVQGDIIAGITRRPRHRTRLVRDVTMVVNSSGGVLVDDKGQLKAPGATFPGEK